MKILTYEDILEAHNDILADTKGLAGIRDDNLLRSSIEGPFQSMFGQDLYPTDIEKIARIGFNIIMNHPFIDANKRTGLHIIFTLLSLNGYNINSSANSAQLFIIELASGNKTYEDLIEWVKNIIK